MSNDACVCGHVHDGGVIPLETGLTVRVEFTSARVGGFWRVTADKMPAATVEHVHHATALRLAAARALHVMAEAIERELAGYVN